MRSKIPARSNQIIPGIYNYCDDWCDRCSMRIFCSKGIQPPAPDLNRYSIFDKMNLILENTERIIAHFNINYPVNIHPSMDPPVILPPENQLEIDSLEKIDHPVMRLVDEYSFLACDYMSNWNVKEEISDDDFFMDPSDVLTFPFGKDVDDDEYYHEDIIEFYLPVLSARINAALFLWQDKSIKFTDSQGILLDVDGFAKCALVLLHESRKSWDKLLDQNPDSVNEIISIYLVLDKLEKELKNIFPDSINFIRPGIDE